MAVIGETVSIISTFTTYHIFKNQLNQNTQLSGPVVCGLSGGIAGLAVASFSLKSKIPCFPETLLEFQSSIRVPWIHLLKSAMGFASAFIIYEALSIRTQKLDMGWKDYLTNFFAGGIAGLAYKATTFPLWRGYEDDPLQKHTLRILSRTFIVMGIGMSISSIVSNYVISEYNKSKVSV